MIIEMIVNGHYLDLIRRQNLDRAGGQVTGCGRQNDNGPVIGLSSDCIGYAERIAGPERPSQKKLAPPDAGTGRPDPKGEGAELLDRRPLHVVGFTDLPAKRRQVDPELAEVLNGGVFGNSGSVSAKSPDLVADHLENDAVLLGQQRLLDDDPQMKQKREGRVDQLLVGAIQPADRMTITPLQQQPCQLDGAGGGHCASDAP